jgi:outer membrane immunogenic protein
MSLDLSQGWFENVIFEGTNMKSTSTLALAIAIGLSGIGAATAADMPMKYKAAPPVIVDSWTGFYIGVNGGGIWGRNHQSSIPADPGTTAFWAACFAVGACPRDYGRNTGSSGEIGGQFGYNWQVNKWVFGVETDFQWTDVKSNAAIALANVGTGFVPFNGASNSKLEWFGTTRGRLGFLAAPNFLLYGTGGVAYGSIARSWTANFPGTAQLVAGADRDTRIGWVAGVGGEWKFNRNWIFGVEYLHMEFDGKSYGATGFGSAGCTALNCNFIVNADRFTTDSVRARISYQFGGPILAKY